MNRKPVQLTRRGFLACSAMASMALVLPARLLGAGSPSNTLNVGVIGCGNRSRSHIPGFNRLPGVRVIAVCDISEDRVKKGKRMVDEANKNQE